MTNASEFHDLSELALNKEGQSWGNLGYWQNEDDDYSAACQALALQMGNAAQFDSQAIVFDAGFGCGDQLQLWIDHFNVKSICGVNISQSQTLRAQKRLANNGTAALVGSILQGDVDVETTWKQAIGNREITHILALDCTYHFPSRDRFVKNANVYLSNGGKIVLTDFMLADQHERKSLKHHFLRAMLKLSRIPATNIVSQSDYRAALEANGFGDASIEDISQPVMLGFAKWYSGTGRNFRKNLPMTAKIKYGITAAFLKWAYHHSVLRYCLISAQKRGS